MRKLRRRTSQRNQSRGLNPMKLTTQSDMKTLRSGCSPPLPLSPSAHSAQLCFPMTPRSKFDNRRRSSLIKSTKAQRARAEAIALKKERLSVACSNTQSNFPKSPHPVHQPKESRPNLVNKNVPTVTQRSLSTSRASLAASATTSANLKKSKTIPLARVSVSTPIEDRIARIQEAKEKANSFLRASTSKSHSKVPNFDKCHEKNFKKQKSIASLVKEVLSPSLSLSPLPDLAVPSSECKP
jgi:hypothetical protein